MIDIPSEQLATLNGAILATVASVVVTVVGAIIWTLLPHNFKKVNPQ